MNLPRVIILGASGFLGQALSQHLIDRGYAVTQVSRRRPATAAGRFCPWDGARLGAWTSELNGAAAVINLCGRSVNCRYDARHRADILRSRVEPTRLVGEALARCVQPPRVWLNASTATIYREARDRPMDETTGELGEGFSVEVARAWEAALARGARPGVRSIALRTSMVLGHGDNSVYPVLRGLVRAGLGGRQADGGQYVSWIHLEDFCRAVEWLLEHPREGAINLTAPDPVPNHEFMRILRESLGGRWGLPAPASLLATGAWMLRTEPELVRKSRWVLPRRLLEGGFTFRYGNLEGALAQLAGSPLCDWAKPPPVPYSAA
ncbi:MAG: TIGR01777 family oxidoreductase [Opitutales bacterium]